MGANTELSLKIAEAQVRAHREASVELERALKAAQDELAYLRTVVTEKFARDIEVAVKPEDAADVAKWAQHPEAVRELLKHTPIVVDYAGEASCAGRTCDGSEHRHDCTVFLAWAALDDPRAAEAIGAAFDRARPVTRHPTQGTVLATDGRYRTVADGRGGAFRDHEPAAVAEWAAGYRERTAFRLASESEQAARARMLIGSIYGRHVAGCCLHVVLDDENLEDSAVAVCVEAAEREGHEDCRELARMLSAMSVEQRSLVTAVPV